MLTKWKIQLLTFLLVSLFTTFSNNLPAQAQTVNYNFIWPEGTTTLNQKIHAACAKFGCDGDRAVKVMNCESEGQNIQSANGLYFGNFQFSRRTWADFSSRAGAPGADIWSVDAQPYVYGWAAGQGLFSHWPRCQYA